jgi:DNA-binding transcriptional MocR family regulator
LDKIDTEELLAVARQHSVGFEPGISFSSREGLRNFARLSFAFYDVDTLEEGVARLAQAINGH